MKCNNPEDIVFINKYHKYYDVKNIFKKRMSLYFLLNLLGYIIDDKSFFFF